MTCNDRYLPPVMLHASGSPECIIKHVDIFNTKRNVRNDGRNTKRVGILSELDLIITKWHIASGLESPEPWKSGSYNLQYERGRDESCYCGVHCSKGLGVRP